MLCMYKSSLLQTLSASKSNSWRKSFFAHGTKTMEEVASIISLKELGHERNIFWRFIQLTLFCVSMLRCRRTGLYLYTCNCNPLKTGLRGRNPPLYKISVKIHLSKMNTIWLYFPITYNSKIVSNCKLFHFHMTFIIQLYSHFDMLAGAEAFRYDIRQFYQKYYNNNQVS